MAAKALPSQEVLRQLLDYDPETGAFTWKKRGPEWFACRRPNAMADTWNARFSGKPAGSVFPNGYHVVRIDSAAFYAHRAAWVIIHGGDLTGLEIDHENGDRLDNRIANLRAVPKAENAKNKRMSSRNASGVTGVRLFKRTGRWAADIQSDGVRKHLGYFENISDAIAARKEAEAALGFHHNHGR